MGLVPELLKHSRDNIVDEMKLTAIFGLVLFSVQNVHMHDPKELFSGFMTKGLMYLLLKG